MNNPTQDGISRDHYDNRYIGLADNGGVHWNSGIANLAFALLVDGGFHPRIETNNYVKGIGLAKAEKVFYRALTTYLNNSATFNSARIATVSAARDLYGVNEARSVEMAWCVVGVGPCPDPIPGDLNNLNANSNTAPFNYWIQCRGSFLTWQHIRPAEYYIAYFSSDINTPDVNWREVYRGNGTYYPNMDYQLIELRLANDGYFAIKACNSERCGVLNKLDNPLKANHAGCPYRI